MENSQYDVEKAQKYAYYYQNENSYYNQNNPQKISINNSNGGLLAIPLIIAIFSFAKYFFTLLLIPAIPFMFLGYKFSLIFFDAGIFIKLFFIVLFGIIGVSIQKIFVEVIYSKFNKILIKWLLYGLLYILNIYIILIFKNNSYKKLSI